MLMQVGFSVCEINGFGGSDDANGNIAAVGIKDKRVKYLVIMYKEMNMQPK